MAGPSPTRDRRRTPSDFVVATPEGRELAAKLKWLMLFRVLMVTVLLGTASFVGAESLTGLSDPLQAFLFAIIVGTYALTLAYALLVPRIRHIHAFAYAQLGGDVIVAGALVLVTGGTDSVFTFLFSLSIINGAILLYRKGALVVASLSTVCFLAIVAYEYGAFGFPRLFPLPGRRQLYYVTFIHLTTFYLVAVLASYLAEQLRRAGRQLVEKQHDLASLQALNDNIVSSLASGLLTVGEDGCIISFNPAAARITGYEEGEVLHHRLAEVFPELADVLSFSADGGHTTRLETLFSRRDNARIFLEYSVTPLLDTEGEAIGNVVHFQDMTEIKMLESAVKRHERLAAVGQLASAIAHEIRNPLAAISGSAEVLGGQTASGDAERRLLDIVVRETERLNGLITDFLQYARPRQPHLVPTDLGALARQTVEAFASDGNGDRPVRVDLAVDGEPWAAADGDMVRQVLWNLLNNAAQAMSDGGTVRVRLAQEEGPAGRAPLVCLRVEDEGSGVSPENRDRIFDPFFTTRPEGTGLGLSVVLRIVQDHDGEVTLQSPAGGGRGAAFLVRLQAVEVERDERAPVSGASMEARA